MKYYAATAAGLAILCALLLTPARAAAAGRSAASPSPADRADLSAFFDGTIPGQLAAGHIPGAAVSVVKDGELVFSGGYGLADTDRQIPVAAERTLFRVGSITKLFTWTAVMQLAEQGRVNLDADICSYLPAGTIANTWPAPVTLANLLTHTGGFEDRGEGLFIRDVDLMIPLSEYVARFMPTRVRAPGITMGYSNFGAALAGYIVERVSGIPYERYIEENILTPLGMSHSSIRQPLPQDLATDLAVGYRYADSKLQQQPEWIQGRPAGALSATAVDMASFMIAHLQQGRRGEVSILREETVRDMQRTHFAQDARASGWTWGFMEMSLNGLRLVWHGGATYVFHSALVLVPEENLGIFVAYNGQGGMVAHQALLQAFMDRYYPVEAPAPSPSPRPLGDSAHLARYAGTYRGTNHMNVSTIEKMFALFSAVPVRVTERGTLAITGVTMAWPAVETIELAETEPLVFQRLDGEGSVFFQQSPRGAIEGFVMSGDPQAVYLRQPFLATSAFHVPLLALLAGVLLAALVMIPAAAIVRGVRTPARLDVPRRAIRILVWVTSAVELLFLVAFFKVFTDPGVIYGVPRGVRWVFWLPIAAIPAVLAAAVLVTRAWFHAPSRSARMVLLAIAALGQAGLLVWLSYWNVLFYVFNLVRQG